MAEAEAQERVVGNWIFVAKRIMEVGQWLKSIAELAKSVCFYLDGEIGFLKHKH